MKKRLLLLTVLIMTFMCLFTIAVSADEAPVIDVPAYDRAYNVNGTEYPLWEKDENDAYHPLLWYLNGEGQMCKVWADNTDSTKLPYVKYNSYTSDSLRELHAFTITDESGAYNGVSSVVIANLHKIYLKSGDTAEITHITKNALKGSTVLKAVFIPASITFMGWGSSNGNYVPFQSCTALEYVEIPSNAKLETICSNSFQGCTSLKAISIPDNVTTINHTTFTGCTSLEAIYMSKNIEQINGHSTWNLGAFYNCAEAYFVSEPFILNSTCSNIPEKEDVYFFPESLETFHSITLRGCASMNDTIVFGTKITTMNGHQFTGYTDTADKNVVYLGDMTDFAITENMTQSGYIHFYFPNTTSIDALKCNTSKNYNAYYYFCNGTENQVGDPHWGSVTWKTIADAESANWKNVKSTTHIANPNASTTVKPTCITIGYTEGACFCGAGMDRVNIDPTNEHIFVTDYDCTTAEKCTADENCTEYSTKNDAHNIIHTLEYVAFDQNGTYNHYCNNDGCTMAGKEIHDGEKAPIITFKGYSNPETEAYLGINVGYSVNTVLLDEYIEVTGESVTIGLFMVNSDINVADIIDGKTLELADGAKGFSVKVVNLNYSSISIEVRGFSKTGATEGSLGNYYTLKLVSAVVVTTTKGETTSTHFVQAGVDGTELETKTFNGFDFYLITADAVYGTPEAEV